MNGTPDLSPLGLPRSELEQLFAGLGEKPFRARQFMRWMYGRGVLDPAEMTDLSAVLRETLATRGDFRLPAIDTVQESADGTTKWRLAVGAGQLIETVFIPEEARGTLCVSSQVGCALDCSFCATGRQGFNRNLTAAEIIGQVVLADRALGRVAGNSRITNVVFMGMGEPLANFRSVVQACAVLIDDLGFQISRRRVTVSTSGLVPQIRKLALESNAALAVSLHAPDDELRDVLVPINRRHPIAELLQACWEYAETTNAMGITFEYVMLSGVNDSESQARALAQLLRNRPAKVNLIPFNHFPGSDYRRSTPDALARFRQVLLDNRIMTMVRRTRGDDIAAACGQLAGQVSNRVLVALSDKGRKPAPGATLREVRWHN